MNIRIGAAMLAASALAACCLPGSALAATVGFAGGCGAGQAGYITAAGHTAVQVDSYTTAALAGLDGLVVSECGGHFVTNAAIDARVHAGMSLVVSDWPTEGPYTASLPGLASLDLDSTSGYDVDFPAGSPILTGPGGVLTNASLDGSQICFPTLPGSPPICFPGFFPSNYGSVASAALPAHSQVLATTGSPAQATAFTYSYGSGRVVYSTVLTVYGFFGPGVATYATNLISWAVPTFTSCAAEGFKGSKLTLCRQVCEMNYSGAKLNALILAWTRLYREDPPCAR